MADSMVRDHMVAKITTPTETAEATGAVEEVMDSKMGEAMAVSQTLADLEARAVVEGVVLVADLKAEKETGTRQSLLETLGMLIKRPLETSLDRLV